MGFSGLKLPLPCYIDKFLDVLVWNGWRYITAWHQGKGSVSSSSLNDSFASAFNGVNATLEQYLNWSDIPRKTNLPVQDLFCLCDVCLVIETYAACTRQGKQFKSVGGIAANMQEGVDIL